MKRVLLIVFIIIAFFAGYGFSAKAYNGTVFGRLQYRGYFHDNPDSSGWEVLPRFCTGAYSYWNGNNSCNSFPNTVNNATSFKNFIIGKLSATGYGSERSRTGAAFIIQTMISTDPSNPDRVHPLSPSSSQVQRFIQVVDAYAAVPGRIKFMENYSVTQGINSYFQGTDNSPTPNDDAFYTDTTSGYSIIFRDIATNAIKYVLRRECANPIGSTMQGLRLWTADPTSTVDNLNDGSSESANVNVAPGESVRFRHYIQNTGVTATNPDHIWFTVFDENNNQKQARTDPNLFYTPGQKRAVDTDEVINVPANVSPGTKYCRKITIDPAQSTGPAAKTGNLACATVTGLYDLNPTVTPNPNQTVVQQGDSIQFIYKIQNVGSTPSPSASCYVKDASGAVVGGISLSCPQVFQPSPTPPITVGTEDLTITNQAVGTQICRQLFVEPANTAVPSRGSGLVCVVVAKTPYVHFMGSDIWAGGGFVDPDGTCTTNTSAKISTSSHLSANAGSIVEYAAFALGEINKFGSGSRPLFDASNFADLGRGLTFANNTVNLGNYGAASHCMDDYAANYQSSPSTASPVNLGSQPSGSWHNTGSLNISGTMPAGSQQVYLVDGDVTITGNIIYVGGGAQYDSPSKLPSLVVIARGDILVDQNVTNIDGIFVTHGTFYTCYQKPMPPTVSTCASLLTVNGAVVAQQLDLYRTRGADGATAAQRQLPAEIFNFTPEIFLHNALNTSVRPQITISDRRELPPRF